LGADNEVSEGEVERVFTHYSSEVAIQLLYDARKAAAAVVKQLPAPAHCWSVPARRRMFLLFCDIASLIMVVPELQESAELVWVSESKGE
jgi:hypothetical protein